MERKAKFVLIGLVGISIVCLFLGIQALNSKQEILREKDELKKENTTLNSKIGKLEGSFRDKENQINSLKQELDKVSREKIEIEKKYDLANKAREELLENLKSQQTQRITVTPPQAQALPQTTDAYWAEVLKAKADLELQLNNIRSELKAIQISNEQLQKEKNTLKSALGSEIKNLMREKEDFKREFEYNKKLTDSLTRELVIEKNDKIKIQDSLTAIKDDSAELSQQLESLNTRNMDLEERLREVQEEKAGIERSFTEMERMLKDKIFQINNLKGQLDTTRRGLKVGISSDKKEKESIELPPIVVRPHVEPSVETERTDGSLVGSILAVNRESNFVIIDLGEDAGVRVGNVFQVYREGEQIATVEVIKASNNVAACDIREETTPITIQDMVR